jgi:hypothetical protein
VSEWISVEDKLPECSHKRDSRGVPVLIFPPVVEVGHADQYTAFYGCRVSRKPTFYLHGAPVRHRITHWMPLPKPPK